MSKIFSTPKMPSMPLIQYVPVETSAPKTDTPATPEENPEHSAEEQRINTLLNRRRGRMGTIGTSLRGVFSDTTITDPNAQPARKTLLGE